MIAIAAGSVTLVLLVLSAYVAVRVWWTQWDVEQDE